MVGRGSGEWLGRGGEGNWGSDGGCPIIFILRGFYGYEVEFELLLKDINVRNFIYF